MKHGFSLVELSIVLVILGLLTGGILAGQNLIRAAELRSVGTQIHQFQSAAYTFRDKYFAMPGDMPNAEDFWGTMTSGTCPNATGGTGTQTCNGDGDGRLMEADNAGETGEKFTFWQHLANAGLIEGTYTGLAGSASTQDADIGVNVPRGKISNAGWWASTFNHVGETTGHDYAIDYGNQMGVGADNGGQMPSAAFLTPEEAWNIDTKMDDGQPARGRIIARFWDDACAGANDGSSEIDDLDASYRLQDSSIQCALRIANLYN